ncbi:alpha/beta fold hydrolase [Arsukibacterium indicum]|uniref:Alpha/beta hydrolase n=1 Tax=Arsukibacterium indicum TaxID=2848612 RepID=A0ABS6MHA9_9GAMM|nr:alpha/beta hydrolase [Arsukibacterium indicum]MBV2128025.1 alpha/beta hydrolase [Arsukibacterium indicum]
MDHSLNFSLADYKNSMQLAALANRPAFSSTAQPVLCLHGWLDNAASFIPLARCLPQLPLLALDFPGHGKSAARSSDAHYYFFDWVEDLVALCQQQGWQQLTIIGHSMGGMVATALAAAFPELVARLVLIDSLGFVTADNSSSEQLRQGIISRLKTPARRKPSYPNLNAAAKARLAQSDFDMQHALLLAERGTVASQSGITWHHDYRLRVKSVYRLTADQAEQLCQAVEAPVLAILAKDGPFVGKLATMQSWYQQLTVQQISGGHHCHMTAAEEVAGLLKAWLDFADC